MRLLQITELQQSYSLTQANKPAKVWGLPIPSNKYPGDVNGIPLTVIESIHSISEGWTGWGFGQKNSWLLFEKQEDAIIANVTLGESYV